MMSQHHKSPPRTAVLVAFGILYCVWGSTYLGIRFAIETIPPFAMAAVRFLSAGMILFVWSTLRGAGLPRWVHWRSAMIIGGLLLVTGNGLLTWAEQYVDSGIAALIVATVPLWMVVLEAMRPGGARPGLRAIAGLLLGLAGIAVLIGPGDLGDGPVHVAGAMAICVASFSWAVGSIYSRSAPQSASTLQNVGMQMLVGGTLLGALSLVMGERIDLDMVTARSAWSLVYLSILGGVVSYSAYVWLLKVSTPAKVSTYAYVNPVVAVLLGWLLAGETVGPRVFLAMAAVIPAVVLIVTRNRKQAEEPSPRRSISEGTLPATQPVSDARSAGRCCVAR